MYSKQTLQHWADWLPHSMPVTKMILPQLTGDRLDEPLLAMSISRGQREWERIRIKYPDEIITQAVMNIWFKKYGENGWSN